MIRYIVKRIEGVWSIYDRASMEVVATAESRRLARNKGRVLNETTAPELPLQKSA